ncbi:MAG: NAD-dependent epimerase/dehydratase family protein [Akkermansiaceae bacterium]|nr:NAD-dependent epimerase/dehydratase family protein [Akkermansiaceae bacterium]MDP4781424.1 NAD-dependent epimerase/dehydratase family protein [Akkermansiaceae bacterium]MDP4848057.1 NAD-dependent epimerase/dehydratase family protein [Akkermansiaceae bacterium]MDP4899074.1 NAD-dependent epimerase/dehydratase family protein [Akkermansiaceae bacterium]
MKRLLVIGAGYLGDAILDVFREGGWEVQGASFSGGEGLLACDVGDPGAVDGLPDADAVVHCAASGRGGGEEAYRRVYLEGCKNLVRRFPGARLVYTSSSSVYGQKEGEIVTEESETVPDRETGRILLAAEDVVLRAGGVVARLAGLYGPGRSVLKRKFLEGEAVIEEDGRRFINQIHRDDAARAVFHLISMEAFPSGEIFNVCDSETLTQKGVYEGMARIFGKELPPTGPRDLDRKRGWTHKCVSNGKLRETGWEPVYPSFLDAVEGV